jgi:hypothetical protein
VQCLGTHQHHLRVARDILLPRRLDGSIEVTMSVKTGTIVSHSVAPQWGSGRVIAVAADKLTIEFSDGQTRKIVAAHFPSLSLADPASFSAPATKTPSAKPRKAPVKKTILKVVPKQDIPNVISDELSLTYPKDTRLKFENESGELVDAWVKQYGFLFDDDDVRMATGIEGQKQQMHFSEWFAAIKMFESTGYYSLNEKYECSDSLAKQTVLKKLVSPEVLRFMVKHTPEKGDMNCPDLLMYKPDYSDWYFCDVKGPGDNLRPEQAQYWQELIEVTGKRIVRVNVKEIK